MKSDKRYSTENEILFYEQQTFRQKFLWIFILIADSLSIFFLLDQIVFDWNYSSNLISRYDVFPIIGTMLFVTVFFLILRLEMIVSTTGISYRFFPIHHKFRYIDKSEMIKITVRKYKTLHKESNGGIRIGFYGKGKAFNISGDSGLQIELKDGESLLIGSKEGDKLKEALKKL